jgi:hypothetical protein
VSAFDGSWDRAWNGSWLGSSGLTIIAGIEGFATLLVSAAGGITGVSSIDGLATLLVSAAGAITGIGVSTVTPFLNVGYMVVYALEGYELKLGPHGYEVFK